VPTDYLLQHARDEYQCCLDVSAPIHQAYAQRHGLEYRRYDGATLLRYTGHWDAVYHMLNLMDEPGTRWVYWVDADALIVDDAELHEALPSWARLGMCRHPNPPHFNCGVLFIRNTLATRIWLGDVLKGAPGHWPHYQQAIMNDLLEMRRWSGLCTRMDDVWNSTVVLDGPVDCHIRAWHAGGPPERRAQRMAEEIAQRGIDYG